METIFATLCFALGTLLIGLGVGSGVAESQIKNDCELMGNFRIGGDVYVCSKKGHA